MNVFHAYDVRGIYPSELNEETAQKIGWAAGEYFKKISEKENPVILIGEDNRSSSPTLSKALISGLFQTGAQIRYGGAVTTPMFYFLVNSLPSDGGVMVTASHNAPEYNGLKFVAQGAKPISEVRGLEEIQSLLSQAPSGKREALEISEENFLPLYLDFLAKQFLELFEESEPKPVSIVFDNGNGIVSLVLEPLLSSLSWIKSVKLFWNQDPLFSGRGPNPILPNALEKLSQSIEKNHAALGIAFDSDGDRVVFLDEKGKEIPGDFLTAWLAKNFLSKNPGEKFVIPVGTSRVVEETIKENGGEVIFSRRGSVFLKEKMREANALFGGERSGHYYFRDFFFSESGIFTFLLFLKFWLPSRGASESRLSEIFSAFAKYPSSGELNLAVEEPEKALEKIKALYKESAKTSNELDGFYADMGEWWFLARLSQTEPLFRLIVEGKEQDLVMAKTKELQELIKNL
ncbi:MAG: phosphomannomutase/phosphoglucomutase [Candidatus Sungbacteria bacterium]|nr:phosphomannomutase/phosphoglucomutase [Candidatus Sungbacteria bacterium]